MASDGVSGTFKVDQLDAQLELIRLRGREELSGLFGFDLEVASTRRALSFSRVVDHGALLTLHSAAGTRHLRGQVVRLAQVRSGQQYTVYRISLAPRAWRLTRTTDLKIFQKKSVEQIVEQVLKEGGVKRQFRLRGNTARAEREYCVQYRETDWAFVMRLLEEEGCYSFFAHDSDKHTLMIQDHHQFEEAIETPQTVAYHPPDSRVAATEQIHDFSYEESVQSDGVALGDFDFEKPGLDLLAGAQRGARAELEVYDYPGLYRTPERGQELSLARMEQHLARRFTARGAGNCVRFAPGRYFELEQYSRDDLNGKQYLLTAVQHEGQKQDVNLDTGEGLEQPLDYANRFECLPRGVPCRPPLRQAKPSVRGVQTATVVGPDGQEIHTDPYGRVRVQFHWDRLGKRDHHSSCWIRVGQTWAGQSWGAMQIPRVGDEVIVDFVDGDPDRPMVVGSVYNGQNMPAYDLPQHKTRSWLKTRSTPDGEGYNELRFEDRRGAEEIFTHAERDQNEVVKRDHTTQVGRDHARTAVNDESITVGHNQTLEVGGDQLVNISGGQATGIGDGQIIHVEGDQKTTVTRDHATEVGRDQHTRVERNRSAVIKTGDDSIDVEQGAFRLTVRGKGLSISGSGGPGSRLKGTPNVKIEADSAVDIEGQDVTIDALGSIKLIAPDILLRHSKIALEGGPITIKGGDVTIEGGKIKIKGGSVDIDGMITLN